MPHTETRYLVCYKDRSGKVRDHITCLLDNAQALKEKHKANGSFLGLAVLEMTWID